MNITADDNDFIAGLKVTWMLLTVATNVLVWSNCNGLLYTTASFKLVSCNKVVIISKVDGM